MDNMSLIDELQERKRAIMDDNAARKRISMLFSEGDFVEIDAFLGADCEGVVCGYGSVGGRLVYAYAQDHGVLNGAIGAAHAQKICRIMNLALETGAPVVGIVDSDGCRINEGIDSMMGLGKIMDKTAQLSGVVPTVTAIFGTCSGGTALAAQSSDFVFAVKSAKMFVNGPQVILGNTGEQTDFSAEALAEKFGAIQFVCENEAECMDSIRNLICYLPSNNLECAPCDSVSDDINRSSDKLTTLAGDVTDVRFIISEIADDGKFIEVSKSYAKNIVIGFATLNGCSVGIVANQAINQEGAIDSMAARKAARFIRFCNCYSIPLVTLIDVPGFAISGKLESDGLVSDAAKLLFAYSEASVPKVNVVMKRAFGSAYLAMSSSADITLCWPTAQISPMLPQGAAVMLYNDDIAASSDPIKAREDKTNEYIKTIASPYNAAAKGYVDDIIEPSITRQRVISALDMFAAKRQNKPAKIFGNIPM